MAKRKKNRSKAPISDDEPAAAEQPQVTQVKANKFDDFEDESDDDYDSTPVRGPKKGAAGGANKKKGGQSNAKQLRKMKAKANDDEPERPSGPGFSAALLMDSSDESEKSESEPEPESESEPEAQPAKLLTKAQKKKLKKQKKKQQNKPEEDLDALLQDFAISLKEKEEVKRESASPALSEPTPEDDKPSKPLTKAQKRKLKKHKKKQAENVQGDDDMEFLDALNAPKPVETQTTEEPSSPPADEASPEESKEEQGPSKPLSKAQKRKLKQKEKKEKEKAAKEKQAETKGTGKKGVSAIKKRLAEEKARQQAEEEEKLRLQREEEELIRQEEEKERLEEERRLEKTRKKKEKIAEKKKAGTYLTAGQRRKQREAEEARKRLFGHMEGSEEKDDEDKPKKKIVYGNKKKGKKQSKWAQQQELVKQAEKSETPSVASESVTAETESWEEEQESETEKPESPEPEEADQEEEEEEDWEEVSHKSESTDDEWGDSDAAEDWEMESGQEDAEDAEDRWAGEDEDESEEEVVQKSTSKKDEEESDEDESDDSEFEGMSKKETQVYKRKRESKKRREEEHEKALRDRSKDRLRSPICCILGHVDTGKTKILDNIRKTNVQDKEAGGITQQIGATYIPMDSIEVKTAKLKEQLNSSMEYKLPGLLVIDTPGHESFSNLRSRGSTLCDIAILVVDIMHGLEPQTLESLNLLRRRKAPFVVALNKIDRIFDWEPTTDEPFRSTLSQQKSHCREEFENRSQQIMTELNQQGINCGLYFEMKKKDYRDTVAIVPTSAITGEGIPDLLLLLTQLTQTMMSDRLQYISSLECTVLEVKNTPGHGMTLDVILSNGVLRQGSTIVVCGMNGPIVTSIRSLLTPHPLRELRVKGDYQRHQEVTASMGIKISAPGLDDAIAGTQLMVCGPRDNVEDLKDEVMSDLQEVMSRSLSRNDRGVFVMASTLGSLEALLAFLKDMKIPVAGIAIGNVHKKHVMKSATMLETQPEYAIILAFAVKVDATAQAEAEKMGVKIFTAEIIYHLFDSFTKYMEKIKEDRRSLASGKAVFPVHLEIMPQHVIRQKNPIIVGCIVRRGMLKLDTPLCAAIENEDGTRSHVEIGRVTGIQKEKKDVDFANKDDEVAVKIAPGNDHMSILYGRQFNHTHKLYSVISRESIDLLKANFRDDVDRDSWLFIRDVLKPFFRVI